jgi:phage gp36-like protein
VTVITDGAEGQQYTQTFTTNYASLDLLVAAISIPGLIAVNNGGLLRLQTQRVGYQQGLIISYTGTANSKLGFNSIDTVLQDQYNYGRSSITTDVTEDEMSYALVEATSEANSYLQRRFKLPLSDWDFGLTKAVCDIAAYTLMFRRGFSPQNTKNYDVNFKENREKAIKWLEGVGNRMIHPVIKGAVKPNPTAAINFVDDRYGWMQISGLYYR